jgi:hypothetical protein
MGVLGLIEVNPGVVELVDIDPDAAGACRSVFVSVKVLSPIAALHAAAARSAAMDPAELFHLYAPQRRAICETHARPDTHPTTPHRTSTSGDRTARASACPRRPTAGRCAAPC